MISKISLPRGYEASDESDRILIGKRCALETSSGQRYPMEDMRSYAGRSLPHHEEAVFEMIQDGRVKILMKNDAGDGWR